MTTRSAYHTQIGYRTGRSSDYTSSAENTKFEAIVNQGLDAFLNECAMVHSFREMVFLDTITISSGDYFATMPTSTQTGFESSIHQIHFAWLRKSSGSTSKFIIKSPFWLNVNYPDRSRSGSTTVRPSFGALINNELHWNGKANDDYTLYLQATHLPDLDLFSSGSDSTANPLSKIDRALMFYGCYEIFDSLESTREADRMLARAYQALQIAILSDDRQPGRIMNAEPRSRDLGVHPNPSQMAFDETTLISETYM